MKAEYCKPWHNVGQDQYIECEIHPQNIDGCEVFSVIYRNKNEFLIITNEEQYLIDEDSINEFEEYFDVKVECVGRNILTKSDKIISNHIELIGCDEYFVYILKDKQILRAKCIK